MCTHVMKKLRTTSWVIAKVIGAWHKDGSEERRALQKTTQLESVACEADACTPS